MEQNQASKMAQEQQAAQEQQILQMADAAFDKLSMLGPVSWLYGRTQDKRFLFLADLDWAVMPPVVLDQCRLFMRGKMPFAFMSWAFVDEEVHQRLLQGQGKLAPHEWKSGTHAWLVDIVTPFGGVEEMLADLYQFQFADRPFVNYLAFNPATQKLEARQLTSGKKTPETTPSVSASDSLH